MIRSVLPGVRACHPPELAVDLRLAVSLVVAEGTNRVKAEVTSDDEALTTCLVTALEKATWPRAPPECTFRVHYPLRFPAAPRPEPLPDDPG